MVTLLSNKNSKRTKFSNDDFGKYLKKQTGKTTFNGNNIESFSWYKRTLGTL